MYRRLPTEKKIALIKSVKRGITVTSACQKADISRTTFYKWLKIYRKAASRSKNKALRSKIVCGQSHWNSISPEIKRKVIKIALKNPDCTIRQIYDKVCKSIVKESISTKGIWTILNQKGLNTSDKRHTFIDCYGQSLIKQIAVDEKLAAIRRYLSGDRVTDICNDLQISRTIIYKWYGRYHQAPIEEQKKYLTSLRPKGEKHWRFIPGIEKKVLKIVFRNPELSCHKIASYLPVQNNKPILGSHGVHNLLKKLNLSRYTLRLAYSQANRKVIIPIPGLLITLRKIFGAIPAISCLPPPFFHVWIERLRSFPRLQDKKVLLRIFYLSFFASLTLNNLFGFWLVKVVATEPTFLGKIGILFATLSLAFGSFFFLYSMKYYLSLALVLSFSRESREGSPESEEKKLKSGQPGFLSLLSRIFGINLTINNGQQINNSQAGYRSGDTRWETGNPEIVNLSRRRLGLEPDLSQVTLQRFPFVSLHLPMYNEKRVVERLLKACSQIDYLDPQTNQARFEIIVVDDSTDETTAIVESFARQWNQQSSKLKDQNSKLHFKSQNYQAINDQPLIKLIHRDNRQGFKGGALREALKATHPQAEFIVVFDADFVPYPDTIQQFLKYFQVTAGSLDFASRHPEQSTSGVEGSLAGGLDSQNQSRLGGVMASPAQPDTVRGEIRSDSNIAAVGGYQSASVRQGDLRRDKVALTDSNIAAVGGYQWHVLNKSENWITRGVRTEYSGSYVIERAGQEILGLLKQISGSVYLVRRDVLDRIGWGESITEDFELTLKLYEQGYKVVYTPYVQAPAECVSTLKRLIRQRMRWAEGHSNNIRRMFIRLIFNPLLTLPEKLEFLYVSPYYLQAAFFLIGTFCWLFSEVVFQTRLPFWISLWGWSLVLTNLLSLPLMNAVGLFLEEAEEKDYLGIFSFILLSYILVPFQAYASVKGFLEKSEGPWFRTPKTGRITDIFKRGRFYRWISSVFRSPSPAVSQTAAMPDFAYTQLNTSNNQFNSFQIKSTKSRLIGNLVVMLTLISAFSLSFYGTKIKTGSLADLPIQTRVEEASGDVTIFDQVAKVFTPKEVLAATGKAQRMVVSGVEKIPADTLIASLVLILFTTVAFLIHLYKKRRKFFKKAVKTILVFTLVLSWLLTSWPRIWNKPKFPPEIKVAQAAISIGSTLTHATGTGTDVLAASHTCEDNTKVLVVVIKGYDSSDGDSAITAVSYGGKTLVEAEYYRNTGGGDDAFIGIYYLKNPTLASSLSVSVTMGGDCTDLNWDAIDLVTDTSADTIILDATDTGTTTAATSHSSIIGTAKTNSIAIGAIVNADSAVADTGITTGTLLTESEVDFGNQMAETAWVAESGGSTTITWSKVDDTSSWACSATFYEQWYPTVALGDPDHEATGVSVTPDLTFTGTDLNDDEVEYEVQVDTATTFDSVVTHNSNFDSYTGNAGTLGLGPTYNVGYGQSFTGVRGRLESMRFSLKKTNSPTGDAYAKVYAHSGVYGTSSVPTGAALATSDAFDVSTLTGTPTYRYFYFTGANQITLTKGVYYVLTIEYSGGDASNYCGITNGSGSGHSGNDSGYNGSVWTPGSVDLAFYIIGDLLNPYINQNSISHAGFANPDDEEDSHPWASGTNIQYTVQSALSAVTYYWRVRGLDPSGTNTYGAWSSPTWSFTVNLTSTFQQSAYRWFSNLDSTSVGPYIVNQDTAMTSDQTPAQGTAFRLRILIHIGSNALASSGQDFKLQIAEKVGVDCDPDMEETDESYDDLLTSTGAIRYWNNTSATDNAALTVSGDDPSDDHTKVTQTYKDLDASDDNINFTNSVGEVPVNQDGEWDFAIVDNSASESTTYCLRITEADGTLLDTYSVVPEFTTVPENPLLLFGLYPLVAGFLKKLRRKSSVASADAETMADKKSKEDK